MPKHQPGSTYAKVAETRPPLPPAQPPEPVNENPSAPVTTIVTEDGLVPVVYEKVPEDVRACEYGAAMDGAAVGSVDGCIGEAAVVGTKDGAEVGFAVGAADGSSVDGTADGRALGTADGRADGAADGEALGLADGEAVGASVGLADDGATVGFDVDASCSVCTKLILGVANNKRHRDK